MDDSQNIVLSASQRARIERNRLKALTLKTTKLIPHPYAKINENEIKATTYSAHGSNFIDSGGGFLIEEDNSSSDKLPKKYISEPAPIIAPFEQPICKECNNQFGMSYLLQTFDYSVCDNCRDNEDKHSLITKTEAKSEYLLKDCDLEKRDPPLRFIVRKNPHNKRWGDMKLYLHIQVEERALEVWGSEEQLLMEREQREDKRAKAKLTKYSKQLKTLRMNVRSSLYDKTSDTHVHSFGPDVYNEEEDNYTKVCTSCNYKEIFEKM